MNRSLIAVAATAALLGLGGGRPIAQATDDWDDDDVSRLKRRALEEACRQEREEMRLDAQRRRAALRRRLEEESRRKTEDFDKLRAGIDPTNNRPLSRQQRRALNRRNFPFKDEQRAASVDTHAKRGDAKQAPSERMGSAVAEGQTPNPDGATPNAG